MVKYYVFFQYDGSVMIHGQSSLRLFDPIDIDHPSFDPAAFLTSLTGESFRPTEIQPASGHPYFVFVPSHQLKVRLFPLFSVKFNLQQLMFIACVAAVKCHPVILYRKYFILSFSGPKGSWLVCCFTFQHRVPLMRWGRHWCGGIFYYQR